jgi:ribosomal protein S18 acetylase RimI-like enzyme
MMQIREGSIADAAGIARVHVDTWRSAYRGIVPDSLLDELSYEQRAALWERILAPPTSTFAYVVEDPATQQIVGFVSGGLAMDREDPLYKGELFTIYILEAYQRQGLGKRLFYLTVERLIEMGLNSMLIWVYADTPARRFYESLGGQLVGNQSYEEGGVMLEQVSYGWLQLQSLLDLRQHRPTDSQQPM